uniref:CTNNB1 binding N-teminal domain-containing protein n=1 Tax=Mesocestoides corti TaxID=53468 RepID=A0A5K3FEA8_MESCO
MSTESDSKKPHTDENSSPIPQTALDKSSPQPEKAVETTSNNSSARVLAGYLPGLDAYGDSDNTDASSVDSDDDDSTDVEDAALLLTPVALTRGKTKREAESCE